MAKLDIKKAAVKHVEKAVFGVVILVVLIGLVSAKWSPYKKTPGEINQKVTAGEKNLQNHGWPEEEKELYPVVSTDRRVDQALYARVDPRPLEGSVAPIVDPRGRNEPVTELVLKTPEDAIATSGRAFLSLAGPAEDVESEGTEIAATTDDKKEDDNENMLDELRQRQTTSGMVGPGSVGGELEGGYEDLAVAVMDPSGSYGAPGGGAMGEFGEGGAGIGGVAAPRLNGQGYFFTSIRAVFPLRDQISKIADATNLSYHQAAALFEIKDFELQRQMAQKGPNPWPEGEEGWEKVDIQVALDVLNSVSDFEADVVNSVVTNSVITMPLPARISGMWRNQATHERIKNFVLTPEQVNVEMEMNNALLLEAVKSKKSVSRSQATLGGFNQVQFDSRGVQGDLMGTENIYGGAGGYGGGSYGGAGGAAGGYGMEPGASGGRGSGGRGGRRTTATNPNSPLEQLVERLAKNAENPKEQEQLIREWIMQRASVDGELLLFRYFDFGVEPGKTYRYRVRFTLKNPNFGKRIADAGGLAHVVAGEERTTDWSNITKPVTVVDDMEFFLTRVNEPKGSTRLLPSAQMDVYFWDSKYGTMVNKAFEVRMGQAVADKVATQVIDAAGQEVKEEDYTFSSDSFLVDVIEDIRIDRGFHNNERIDPSLRLDLVRGHRDHFRNESQVLIKTDEEELVEYDGTSMASAHEQSKKYIEFQKEQYDRLLKAKTAAFDAQGMGEYGDLLGGEPGSGYGGADGMDMGMMGAPGGGRKRSSLRKRTTGRGRGGSGGSGSGGGSY